MTALQTLEDRYADVMSRVAAAAQKSGRSPRDILVVAVTKYADMDDVRRLVAMGHRDLGESRVQQLVQREAMLRESAERGKELPNIAALGEDLGSTTPLLTTEDVNAIRWHMIGHIQKNKAKKLVGCTRLIHTVDSFRVAEELQAQAIKKDIEVDVLVQINATAEKGKYGCALPAAHHLAEQVDDMFPLQARGFMCMGPTSRDEDDTRLAFERTADTFREVNKTGLAEGKFNILSMGMSGDFELAIECGANVVRVGSGIFGGHTTADDTEDSDEG